MEVPFLHWRQWVCGRGTVFSLLRVTRPVQSPVAEDWTKSVLRLRINYRHQYPTPASDSHSSNYGAVRARAPLVKCVGNERLLWNLSMVEWVYATSSKSRHYILSRNGLVPCFCQQSTEVGMANHGAWIEHQKTDQHIVDIGLLVPFLMCH